MSAAVEIQGCREWDVVLVTGPISSEGNTRVEKLHGTVATASADGAVKIWPTDPNDPQLPKNNDGKLWFMPGTFTLELVEQDEINSKPEVEDSNESGTNP
jgi:hypothetical protein